jgi:hypothetical protein
MNEPTGRELTTSDGVGEASRQPTDRYPGEADPTIHFQRMPRTQGSTGPKRRIVWVISKPVLACLYVIGAVIFFSLTQTKPAKTNPPAYWRIALDLAQKGAEEAVARLQNERGLRGERRLNGSEFALSSGWASGEATGSCHVKIEEPDEFTRVIDSTATVRSLSRAIARRTVRVEMRRLPLFESGLLARERLLLEPGVELSSYSSMEGTDGFAGDRTNSDIRPAAVIQVELSLPRASTVAAAVLTALRASDRTLHPGRSAGEGGGKGAIRRHHEDMPLILPPWRLAAFPGIDLSNCDVLSVHESGAYPHVRVEDSSTLFITGDASIYVVGSLIIKGRGKVVIKGSVTNAAFYVEKDVAVEKDAAVVNLSRRPSAFTIYGMDRASSIRIESGHPFVGTIYAPQSEITVGPGVDFFGAVCGKRVRVCRGATICYDEGLRSIPSAWRRFVVVSREEL